MLFAAKWAKTGDIIANAGIVFVSVQANIPYFTCINHSFIFLGGGFTRRCMVDKNGSCELSEQARCSI